MIQSGSMGEATWTHRPNLGCPVFFKRQTFLYNNPEGHSQISTPPSEMLRYDQDY